MHNCQKILTASVLQKGYFVLSPAVIHSIAFSVGSVNTQKTIGISNIDTSFVCLFFTPARAFGTPRPIPGSRDSNDVMQLQNVINKH